MNFELQLLKLFCTKEVYEKYSPYLKVDVLPGEVQTLLRDLKEFYQDFPDTPVAEISKFQTWFQQLRHPDMDVISHNLYSEIFKLIDKTEVDFTDECVSAIMQHFQSAEYKERILEQLDKPEWSPMIIRSLIDEYESLVAREGANDYASNDPADIFAQDGSKAGLRWRLHCLQKTLGSIKPGQFGVVAAGKDTGKSAFLVSETVNFASQLREGCVLWFTTEQTKEQVQKRIWGAVFQRNPRGLEEYLITDKSALEAHKEEYTRVMQGDIDRIRIFDANGFTTNHIRKKIQQYKPKLVIIDMLDHITYKDAVGSADWRYLQRLYHEIRMLARTCPILGSSQCDGQTSGVYGPQCKPPHKPGEEWVIRYIPFKMLEGSKVGKQGATDFIITIGLDPKLPATRFINVPTSKTGAKIQSEASFDIDTALYTDYDFTT